MKGGGQAVVTRSTESGVAWITLNRPDKKNALNRSLMEELKTALREADADADVTMVAIRGAGADFCAGADLAELHAMAEADAMDNLADVDSLAELFLLPRRMSKPVAAVVQGRALAGGCGLATSCDLVLAGESATFGYPEVHIGFVPAMVMAILRRNMTEKRAFELIVGGEVVGAAEAERLGLINRVYPDAELESGARNYLADLAKRAPAAVALSKRLLYHQDGMSFEAAVRAGADINVVARTTSDAREGLAQFLAKSGKNRA
jgi:methylglutaconyl-CoA hydratase